jgi:integrase
VDEAIDAYQQFLREKGTGEVSYNETVRRLRLFFPDRSMPVARTTPERAKGYYEAFRQRLKPNGQPISVDYHRCALINARSFLSWTIEQGFLSANPLANVKGIGRRNAGKPQHTGDETRKLYSLCLSKAEAGDRAALGVLMALLMALRSGDITRRLVRDVDLDGTVLRVEHGKTRKSNRPRRIPVVLQPMLRGLVKGRDPFEPLFKTPYTNDGHHTRRWLETAMVKICAEVGVPYVCPHALKGTAGTLLADTGALADQIADHLSHEKVSTTEKHYVARGAFQAAQAERAFGVIAGGKR